jgi:peptidylprolyl isomerase
MPSSKEARTRQNRQKERVAAQLAERRRVQRQRRRVGAVAGVISIVIVAGVGYALGSGGNGPGVAVSPTTLPAKTCVGLKDPLPKGAPAMPLTPGPPPTSLATRDLKVGTGAVIPKNAKVMMNYVGVACSTGKIFDSSYSHNQTFAADLSSAGHLIVGWQQGIPGMKIGGVRLLSIPADLAYGAAGSPPAIAADEPLYFLVEAVKLG